MAKKTKRKVSTGTRAASSNTAAPVVVETPPTAPASTPTAVSSAPRTYGRRASSVTEQFQPDYTYIINDLKRIGVLAGGFFAILIVLSFIIK